MPLKNGYDRKVDHGANVTQLGVILVSMARHNSMSMFTNCQKEVSFLQHGIGRDAKYVKGRAAASVCALGRPNCAKRLQL